MSLTDSITAVFRNGTFTPDEPVSLPEGTRVRLNLEKVSEAQDKDEDEDLVKLIGETEFFAEHQKGIQTLYPNEYVAIHNGQVIDHDGDRFALSLRILEASRDEAVLIKHVEDRPIPEYSVRSPRLERGS